MTPARRKQSEHRKVSRRKKSATPLCETSGKVRFRTEAAAKLAVAKAEGRRREAEIVGVESSRQEIRTYPCPECHWWHLTSKD